MKRLVFVFFSVFLIISLYLNIPISVAYAYYTNMPASVVVGQSDFVTNSTGTTGNKFKNTFYGILIDARGRLIISDAENHRVLIWNSVPTSNGISADLVLGQPDLTTVTPNTGGRSAQTLSSPHAIASDGTHLVIGDSGNRRILIWNSLPTTTQQPADIVLLEPDMATAGGSDVCDNSHGNNGITGLAISNGRLLASFGTQRRILIWNTIPITNGTAADLVLGQVDFNTCSLQTISANTFNLPRELWIDDSGRLYVADQSNHRVLIWNSIPTTNNKAADVVVGQPDFTTSNSVNSASSFTNPIGVTTLGNRLFIGNASTNRVLVYNSIPTTNGVSADLVIGQTNYTGISPNGGGSISPTGINGPHQVYASGNKFFIGDSQNARVLIFNNTIDTPQLNINLPLEKIDDTHLRVRGNIQLGDRSSTYAMQWVKAEVNGQGLGFVTNLGGGRDNGDNLTLYDFFHEFSPGNVVNTDMNNYTLKLVASSFNADTTSLFYFQPFNFKSLTRVKNNLAIDFSVNKYQIQKVRDNLDHFEIQTSTDSGKFWRKLSTNITTDKIDTNTGQVYVTISNSLLPGIKYSVRLIAVSRDSNWQQPSNILSYFVPKKKTSR